MVMCSECGSFDGHHRGCSRLDNPEDIFFPERPPEIKKKVKKRKYFGVKDYEEKQKKK